MGKLWNRIKGSRPQRYDLLPLSENEPTSPSKRRSLRRPTLWKWCIALVAIFSLYFLHELFRAFAAPSNKSCDTIDDGYRCSPKISHFWGQYSLWFSVDSNTKVEPPKGCEVSFASVLSRHGGRDPTASKTKAYSNLITKIHNQSKAYPGKYAFLKDYTYTLGADLLTDVGRQEMVNSGAHFYRRYKDLASKYPPFVRSSGQDRVIESANKWLEGFAQASKNSTTGTISVTIPEDSGVNNTLSHGLCTAFEEGPYDSLGNDAQDEWTKIFVPPIKTRVNTDLTGANLTTTEIIYLMDLCSFNTLASPTAAVSEFCWLFTEDEWHQYDYYQSLGKYYGNANGNPLGPTQGVGFVNELLARLTGTPVKDSTTTNSTLDSNSATFPLERKVYADFSHDNDMSSIFGALGLYNSTKPLSKTKLQGTEETNGYSAAWTVPFAARAYFEKIKCDENKEEYVRIIVNDRVIPLEFCGGDNQGRCVLSKFVESQSFSRNGGNWDQCFTESKTPRL